MYERMAALTPKTNPFFAHADVQLWLAVRGGRDVGRISAQIDHLATEAGDAKTGNFGMIAAEDDPAIFQVLFRTAEDWLKARGCTRALGPFNLSINEEVGLLVDGFDTKPMVMMGHDLATPPRGSRRRATPRPRTSTPMSAIPARPAPVVGAPRQARPARGRGPARAGHEPLRRGGQSPDRHPQRRLVGQLGLHPHHRGRDRPTGQGAEGRARQAPDPVRGDRRRGRPASSCCCPTSTRPSRA
jgi:hypothetical protein